MHLEGLDGVTPAVVAHLLGNDADAIQDALETDYEEEQAWSRSALDEPDPEFAHVELDGARACAISAQRKSAALAHVRAEQPRPVAFEYTDDLAEIQRWELAWLAVHRQCSAPWNKTEDCPTHGPAITAGRARQHQAKLALLNKVRRRIGA